MTTIARGALILAAVLALALPGPAARAERVKDLATVAGVRSNQLVGYGLVVGLDGTGDQTSQAPFTTQSLKNFLAQLGVNVPPEVWNVQCEECHGPGLQHARDGTYRGAGEATCRKCHDPDNSPEFDYELYSSYGVH